MLVIVLTGLYTVLGGMRAVAYNDAMQTIVLIIGSATLTIYGLLDPGRRQPGRTAGPRLRHSAAATCSTSGSRLIPPGVEAHLGAGAGQGAAGNMVREAWYFNDHFPWLGMAICAPVIGLWYWCTDQYIVQRALGAPNEKTARRGSIFAAFLKLFPVYLFIIPGTDLLRPGQASGNVPATVADDDRQVDRRQGGGRPGRRHGLSR